MQSLEALHQSHLLVDPNYQKSFHLEYGSVNEFNVSINGNLIYYLQQTDWH